MLETVLSELRVQGHLRGEVLPPPAAAAGASLWIFALQVIGGWLAAVFMLLFLGIGVAPMIASASGWVIVGLAMTALTALWIAQTAYSAGTVLSQFQLVASLAGHGALLVAASEFGGGERSAFLFMVAVYEFVLLLWVAWMPHRLVVALIGAGALLAALDLAFSQQLMRYSIGVYWFAACLLWQQERRWLALGYGEAVKALACALSLLGFAFAVIGFYANNLFDLRSGVHFDALLLGAVNIVFMLFLSAPYLNTWRHRLAVALLIGAVGATWPAPAVGMGALALVFGFARGHRWLMWMGGALLLFGVGRFYYELQLNLLYKSALMLLSGALLLAVRALIGEREQPA